MMAITATTVRGFAVVVLHDAEPGEIPVAFTTAHHPAPLRPAPTPAERAAIRATLDEIARDDRDQMVRDWAKLMSLYIESRSQ